AVLERLAFIGERVTRMRRRFGGDDDDRRRMPPLVRAAIENLREGAAKRLDDDEEAEAKVVEGLARAAAELEKTEAGPPAKRNLAAPFRPRLSPQRRSPLSCPRPLRERAPRCCRSRRWVRGTLPRKAPHPFELFARPLCPLPQGGHERRAHTSRMPFAC